MLKLGRRSFCRGGGNDRQIVFMKDGRTGLRKFKIFKDEAKVLSFFRSKSGGYVLSFG